MTWLLRKWRGYWFSVPGDSIAANLRRGRKYEGRRDQGLLETRFGFHIVKLVERRSYDLADKRQIRAALFDTKRAKLFNEYFDKTKKSYKVEINREALNSVKK